MSRRAPHPARDAPGDMGCACANARQTARVLTQLYDAYLSRAGMEAPQFALLLTLQKQGPSSPGDLGRRFVMDKTTVSRNLRVLARRGWITVSPARSDKRARAVALTAEGESRLARAKPEWKRAQDALHGAMTSRQWSAMLASFATATRVAHALDRPGRQPAEVSDPRSVARTPAISAARSRRR